MTYYPPARQHTSHPPALPRGGAGGDAAAYDRQSLQRATAASSRLAGALGEIELGNCWRLSQGRIIHRVRGFTFYHTRFTLYLYYTVFIPHTHELAFRRVLCITRIFIRVIIYRVLCIVRPWIELARRAS